MESTNSIFSNTEINTFTKEEIIEILKNKKTKKVKLTDVYMGVIDLEGNIYLMTIKEYVEYIESAGSE